MIHLALQSEFSFKKSFMHIDQIHNYVVDGRVGIADINNTFGHIALKKEAEKHGFNPIYGVRLHVLPDDSVQRVCNTYWVFLAKNDKGLREIYRLVQRAYEQFYYVPKLNESDVDNISDDVICISPDFSTSADYQAIGQGFENSESPALKVMIDRNQFPSEKDRPVYELLAGSRKNSDGYSHMFEECTYPQHILSEEEWLIEYDNTDAIAMTYNISVQCNASIPDADMVKWDGDSDILQACLNNTSKISNWNQEYIDRLTYEIGLITDKGYIDYFMICLLYTSPSPRD